MWEHCQRQKKEACVDRWVAPRSIRTNPHDAGRLLLTAGDDGAFEMNDWSFGQLCRLAGAAKETVNRLVPDTAARVFAETLPTGNKPLQLLTNDDQVRSIHGTSYTRLFNAELLTVVREFATDFEAPPERVNGGTGLYAGEQDMFTFMIEANFFGNKNRQVHLDGLSSRPEAGPYCRRNRGRHPRSRTDSPPAIAVGQRQFDRVTVSERPYETAGKPATRKLLSDYGLHGGGDASHPCPSLVMLWDRSTCMPNGPAEEGLNAQAG